MAPPPKGYKGSKANSKKGKRRNFSSPEEIERAMNKLNVDSDEEQSGSGSEESSSDSEEIDSGKPKGVASLINIENPNRNPKQTNDGEVQLTRREREEIEKQKAKERYMKLTAEGKTDQAKADLARLAMIRQQREEAARKREMERQVKDTKGKK